MKRFSPRTLSLITAGVLSLASAAFAQQGPPPGGPDQGPPPAGDGPRVGQPGGGGGNQDDVIRRMQERRRQEGQPGDQAGPGGQGGPGGPGGGGQGGPGGGPGGPGGGPRGGGQNVPPEVARFQSFINMVDSYAKLAKDPDASAVAAVVSAADVLRAKGPQASIEYFTKILPDVKSPTVQRAIRLQLMDFYKASNQPEKALEQLQLIMTTAEKKVE